MDEWMDGWMDGWMDYEHRNKTLFFLIIVKDIDLLCVNDPGNIIVTLVTLTLYTTLHNIPGICIGWVI